MKMRTGMVMALAGALAVGACQKDNQSGGDTSLEDTDGGVPVGAIPAPEGSNANTAAAGMPLDSTAADSTQAGATAPSGAPNDSAAAGAAR